MPTHKELIAAATRIMHRHKVELLVRFDKNFQGFDIKDSRNERERVVQDAGWHRYTMEEAEQVFNTAGREG
jgi:hypothetical protein